MTRIRIDISYKGTKYHGWQIQENAHTVQEELNKALSILFRENVETVGCGRTDTGVHAKQYTAHFDCSAIPEPLPKLHHKLNTILDSDIAVFDLRETYPGFHARFDAVRRTYKYFIHSRKDPFKNEYSTFIHYQPDADAMNDAANFLTGNKDFSSFCKSHSDVENNFCNVFQVHWERAGDDYSFTVSANRFLRNMVRAMVGTMLDVGRGKITTTDFLNILNAKNRCKAGESAPPQGLFLWKNEYLGQ